ncbi:MAG: alpha/beta hydrolase-fold protein [Bryobacteraceae bacterium]
MTTSRLAALAAIVLLSTSAHAQRPTLESANFTDDALTKGTAWKGQNGDFLFAISSSQQPKLVLDRGAPKLMKRARRANLWIATATLETGLSHSFSYLIDGKPFGGRNDIPAYLLDSYDKPGVPQGKLSEKLVWSSKIYDGMLCDYWIYVPAQYNPATPAAVMVWQDGEGHVKRDGDSRVQIVIDNLTQQKKMPVAIHVFISPGKVAGKSIRSIQYDSVNDTYVRFLRDEVLSDVAKKYNLRSDSYSRAITGQSSGGICSFNAAWFMPDQFSRVLTRIGSFTSIQWKPGILDGGNVYPFKIRKEPKHNIRVWVQDGSEDLENDHGSWPLQNLQLVNSLKLREYDFHFTFGGGAHSGIGGYSELPVSLAWLWRDYNPAKTEQTYQMDPAEKDKPYFRVKIYNREAR